MNRESCQRYLEDPEANASHLAECAECRALADGLVEDSIPPPSGQAGRLSSTSLPLAPWEGAAHRSWPLVAAGALAVAVIAGLIERRFPGEEKSRRQVTFSSDLIYDALRKHEPDHILLRATRQDAAHQLADLKRLGDLLKRAKGRIEYRRLDRISPLAVPVLLEIGKERVLDGTAEDELLDIAAQELIDEATRLT